MTYCFSTDMQDEDIIFGGEKKLAAAIQEAYDLFHPKAIAIFSTCPVGLIGDDVHAVAREMKEKLGDQRLRLQLRGLQGRVASRPAITSPTTRCSSTWSARGRHAKAGRVQDQPAGRVQHRRRRLRDRPDPASSAASPSSPPSPATRPTTSSPSANQADLNCVMCHRSINYVADMMEKKYGIPWIKVNFIGAEATAKSLRKIAQYFGDHGADRPRRGGHRRGDAGGRGGTAEISPALRGQDGDAVRRRQSGPTTTRSCSPRSA